MRRGVDDTKIAKSTNADIHRLASGGYEQILDRCQHKWQRTYVNLTVSTVWRAVATSRSSIDANHKWQRTYVNLTVSTVRRAVATGKRAKTQKRSQCDLPARFYFPLSTLNSLRANGSPHRLASGGYEQMLEKQLSRRISRSSPFTFL